MYVYININARKIVCIKYKYNCMYAQIKMYINMFFFLIKCSNKMKIVKLIEEF